MAEAGRLTQAQGGEYRGWYRSRPDELHRGPFNRFKGGGFGTRGGHHSRGWHTEPPAAEAPFSGSSTADLDALGSDL